MTLGISGIDHPVLAVKNLAAARAVYERLGFTIPPQGSHLEWGTGNWCIMFENDYLELRGIVDPSRYLHHLDEFLISRGEGLMGVAFAPAQSAKLSEQEAQRSGIKTKGVKQLTRRFEVPGNPTFPKFEILYVEDSDFPELGTTVVCQHLTPELIRAPEWLSHANGVFKVIDITVVVEDPWSLIERYQRLVGPESLQSSPDRLVVKPKDGASLTFLTAETARVLGLAEQDAELPFMAAMSLATRNLQSAVDLLRQNGIKIQAVNADWARVAKDHACGVTLFLIRSE